MVKCVKSNGINEKLLLADFFIPFHFFSSFVFGYHCTNTVAMCIPHANTNIQYITYAWWFGFKRLKHKSIWKSNTITRIDYRL